MLSFSFVVYLVACTSSSPEKIQSEQQSTITCDENGCRGMYIGPEFRAGDDVAHQFSNKMTEKVGDQLKALYSNGNFSKVDFTAISMTTKGMGTGKVTYRLAIPFVRVSQKCDAFTSFDHVGGWNHTPALSKRKIELASLLLDGDSLNVSQLATTPEGLQEYWIQWKNKVVQAHCAKDA